MGTVGLLRCLLLVLLGLLVRVACYLFTFSFCAEWLASVAKIVFVVIVNRVAVVVDGVAILLCATISSANFFKRISGCGIR
jgi:hypothetical protein